MNRFLDSQERLAAVACHRGCVVARRPLHDLTAHAGGVDSAAAGSAPEAGAWRWAWEDGELGPDATEGNSAGPVLVLECSMGAERLLPDPI